MLILLQYFSLNLKLSLLIHFKVFYDSLNFINIDGFNTRLIVKRNNDTSGITSGLDIQYMIYRILITGHPGYFVLDFWPKFLNNSAFENNSSDYILR
jgi:hypothetical protein